MCLMCRIPRRSLFLLLVVGLSMPACATHHVVLQPDSVAAKQFPFVVGVEVAQLDQPSLGSRLGKGSLQRSIGGYLEMRKIFLDVVDGPSDQGLTFDVTS